MKKLIIVVTIVCFASFMPGVASYPVTSDEYERRNGNGSGIMAPGYLNIDKQRTESMKESVKPAPTTEGRMKAIGADLKSSLTERTTDRVVPDVKGPKGGEDASGQTVTAKTGVIDAGGFYISAIGSGTDQRDENGALVSETGERMVSEVIDGNRCYFVGFTDIGVGSITDAIKLANGGIIIAKSGIYAEDITMIGTIKLYGGYSEDGTRDVWNSPTEILGNVEIMDNQIKTLNGLKFHDISGLCQPPSYGAIWGNVNIGGSIFAGQVDFTAGNSVMINSSRFLSGSSVEGAATIRNCDLYDTNITAAHFSGAISMSGNNFYGVTGFSGTIWSGSSGEIIAYNNFFENPEMAIGDTTSKPNERSISYNYSPVKLYTENVTATPPKIDITTTSPWFTMGLWYTGKGLTSGLSPTLTFTATGGLKADIGADKVTGIFGDLLADKDALMSGKEGVLDPALMAKLVQDALGESALVVPVGELTPQEMEMAVMLANILVNPTEGQKVILDALESLVNEINALEEEGASPELKEAKDAFTQMVATALLAQALPDLLKARDVANIKGIFSELDSEKSHVLLEYRASVKTYYDSVVKELAANMALLQLKDILSKHLTKEELGQLPQTRIDEIISKMKTIKDKTVTEQEILKLEAKYRKESLEPAKRALEESMTTLLRGFSQRIFGVLDEAGLVKEEGKGGFNIDLSTR